MKKILLCVAVACIAFAAKDDSGVGEYKASCKMCHGAPYKGSNMLASSEWEEMFADSYKKLKSVHAADDKALKVLEGQKFMDGSAKLLEFLKNNAQDSGNVRACSGASCG